MVETLEPKNVKPMLLFGARLGYGIPLWSMHYAFAYFFKKTAQLINFKAETSPHDAYMPSHIDLALVHAQSSHMQFPGLCHSPQPASVTNPHHMGLTMSGSVGVGTGAPGT